MKYSRSNMLLAFISKVITAGSSKGKKINTVVLVNCISIF